MELIKAARIKLSELHAFAEDNFSRDHDLPLSSEKENRELVESFVEHQWNSSEGTMHLRVMTPDEQIRAWEERKAQRKNLEENEGTFAFRNPFTETEVRVPVKASEVLRGHIAVYGEKIKKPQYSVVTCFRRNATFPYVFGAQVALNQAPMSEIPCEIYDYANINERMEDCLRENHTKAIGMRALSDADMAISWWRLYQQGYKEADYQRAGLARGMRQKAYTFCKLHDTYQDLKILEGVRAGNIPLKSLDKEKMRNLVTVKAPESDVAAYILQPKEGNNKAKVATKTQVANLVEQTQVHFIAVILRAQLDNSLDTLNPMIDKADELNKAFVDILGPELITL